MGTQKHSMKLLKPVLLVIFAWFATASSLALASTFYSYAGNPFADYSGTITGSMSVTGTMELASALAPDLAEATLNPLSFNFSDGVNTITQADNDSAIFMFTTDSTGQVMEWTVSLENSLPTSPDVGDSAGYFHGSQQRPISRWHP